MIYVIANLFLFLVNTLLTLHWHSEVLDGEVRARRMRFICATVAILALLNAAFAFWATGGAK